MKDIWGEELQGEIADRFTTRRKTMKHIISNSMYEYPTLEGEYTIGNYSRTWIKHHTRAVIGPKTVAVGGDMYDTPTSLARETLNVWYPKRARHWTKPQWERLHQPDVTMPCYAYPGRFSDGAYVDIKSAWWSIARVVGWDCDYFPGRWLKPDRPIPAGAWFGEKHKTARSALVSIGLSRGLWVNDGYGRQVYKPAWNKFYNRDLFGWIGAVLGAIAEECREAGAIYWNVDGAIYPTFDKALRGMGILEEWGLDYGIKGEGAGWVLGPGNYRIGGYGGGRAKDRPCTFEAKNKPTPEERRWIYARWMKLLDRYGAGVL